MPSLAYVVPVVFTSLTPPFAFASNKTLILSPGRSSSFGASGSVLFGSG